MDLIFWWLFDKLLLIFYTSLKKIEKSIILSSSYAMQFFHYEKKNRNENRTNAL